MVFADAECIFVIIGITGFSPFADRSILFANWCTARNGLVPITTERSVPNPNWLLPCRDGRLVGTCSAGWVIGGWLATGPFRAVLQLVVACQGLSETIVGLSQTPETYLRKVSIRPTLLSR